MYEHRWLLVYVSIRFSSFVYSFSLKDMSCNGLYKILMFYIVLNMRCMCVC